MTTSAATTENKSFASPDETRTFERGVVELVDIAGTQIGRLTLQPGWRWSEHVKPIAGTDSCQVPHDGYAVSGQLRIFHDDGTETDIAAGDAYSIAPGHDATVLGDVPFVGIDFSPVMASDYAKPSD